MERLDPAWLRAHPLPAISHGGDKHARGCALIVGGSAFVPGALLLTGEAALRAGAGKLRLATVDAAAIPLAVRMPEAAMIALPAGRDGELSADAADVLGERLGQCDALVLGPGMAASDEAERFVAQVIGQAPADLPIVLDAGAMTAAAGLRSQIAARGGRTVMTPHAGEMCKLAGVPIEAVRDDPRGIAARVAREFGAVVALKGERTIVMSPAGDCVRFEGGNNGLATSGSGDVLAGVIGGLAARGADAFTAAAWGVYVHGTAGERAASEVAPIGYLARELLPHVPAIIAEISG